MSAYDLLIESLRVGMREGNRHETRLTVGRLAGGYYASGSITTTELHDAEAYCVSLSNTPERCRREWDEAVIFGKREPIQFNDEYFFSNAPNEAMDWNSTIGDTKGSERIIEPKKDSQNDDNYKIIDTNWIQDEEIPDPGDYWSPVTDLTAYLSALFKPEEYVGYIVESFIPEGECEYKPTKGSYSRTAGQLIKELERYKGDIGAALGDHDPKAGAWMKVNPLDGKGVKVANVTSFRYALVESDDISIPRQYAIIKKLELPVAALVHSGGKSLHAIVRIDAKDYDQYKERVNFLYKICNKNGLKVDTQNKNPSRAPRMPGVTRNGNKQFLVDINIGQDSWEDWKNHIEDINDDLPDIEESMYYDEDNEPELSPPIIDGLLRQGHKLLISGPSKAGKSFALLQLCIACADGGDWFGWEVAQGKVLYVNLELDPKSCKHRIWKICESHGHGHVKENMDIWNLRGHAVPLDKLVPKLIRRAMKKRYTMIVIDPLYKVLTGDENSAGDITKSFNEIDKLCTALNASLVVCHHHSKGEQWQKASRDRSSGSGVFARDPDAVLDLIELEIDEDRRKDISNRWECEAMAKAFIEMKPDWANDLPLDDILIADKIAHYAESRGAGDAMRQARGPAIEAAKMATGWRIEDTLREFPFSPAKNHFYRYPVHVPDKDGLLTDAKAHGEAKGPSNSVNQTLTEEEIKERRISKKENKQKQFMMDFEALKFDREDGNVTIGELMEQTGLSRNTIKQRIDDDCPFLFRDNNGVISRIDTDITGVN